MNFMNNKQNTRDQPHPAVEKIAKIAKEIDAIRHELFRKREEIMNLTCAEVRLPRGVLFSDQTDAAEFWWEIKKDKWLQKWQQDAAYQSAVSKLSDEERRLLCL